MVGKAIGACCVTGMIGLIGCAPSPPATKVVRADAPQPLDISTQHPTHVEQVVVPPRPRDSKPYTGDAIAELDPCGDKMENLAGAWLAYQGAYRREPRTLEDLRPFVDGPQPFTSPVTGKQFLFSAQGLGTPGSGMRIYIYDAEPSLKGGRWCVMSKAGAATGAPVLFADRIPEETFKEFLDASNPPPPTTAPAPAVGH